MMLDPELELDMVTDFITVPLYKHQKKSIRDMEQLEKKGKVVIDSETYIETRIGILSDLPGYGKTLSVLGLIGKTVFDECDRYFYKEKKESSTFVTKIKVKEFTTVQTSLILVNVSLLSQWIFELSRTTLRYLSIYNKSDIEGVDLSKYDVILLSHTIYNLFSQVYRNKCWKRFVIDEPASLKIASMEECTAMFYWLVTATPYELYPRRRTGFTSDLLPEMDIVQHIILKNDDQFVRASYDMPITNHIYYKITCDIAKLFEGLVNPNIMEMIEAGNMPGVLSAFGICTTSSIVSPVEMESTELSTATPSTPPFHGPTTIIYAFKRRKTLRINELMSDENNIDKIQTIQSHLQLLDERLQRYASEHRCVCCNGPHRDLYMLTCCQTPFCGACFNPTVCMMCKSMDTGKCIITEDCDVREETAVIRTMNKVQTIMSIISDSVNKKILVFSNFNESFLILKKFLEEKKIHYLELRGTKEKRDNTIDLYKTGHVNVLLLNTIHSGAGLNLEQTTDIIVYHRLHDYQKTQVIGRANRIGRKINLNVHYLE